MLKFLVSFVLLMSTPALGLELPKQCNTKPYEEECTVGRFKHQCTIIECIGRKLIIVRNKKGEPRILIIKSPCLGGEQVIFKNEIEL